MKPMKEWSSDQMVFFLLGIVLGCAVIVLPTGMYLTRNIEANSVEPEYIAVAEPNRLEFVTDSDLGAVYLCPKHGEIDLCMSFYLSGAKGDFCTKCLMEVMDKAGVHRVVLKER